MKYKAKTLTPVQVGQVVKALILMGAQKVTVEEVEKERFSMPKLNFYDTDAVKAFVLNILVENEELRRDLDFYQRQSASTWEDYKTQKARADAAEAKAAELEKLADSLAAERDAALAQKGGAE